jgi:transcriptional regulator with XRE-family HTH domain
MREKRSSTVARKVLDDTKKTIGETIKQLRKENLWTQEELASRIKTTTISVGRWEKNLTRPSLHFQQKLCEIFGKSPEELGFLPQSEPEHGEGSQSNDLHQEMEPGQRVSATTHEPATNSASLLAPVPPPPPLQHTLIPRNIVLWQHRRFLLVMVSLNLLLFLLSGVFFSRQSTLSSTSPRSSCQTPSSYESATAIYAQVMCHHALFTSALDQQDGLQWDENKQCRFQQGSYHVLLPTTAYVTECFAHVSPFGPNFAFQADLTVLNGFSGGLVFRAATFSPNWEVVNTSRTLIDIWGQYNFYLAGANAACHLSKNSMDPYYCHPSNGPIIYGLEVTNTMMVIALGSQVYFYVNGHFIDQAQTPASSPLTGFLGVFANGYRSTADVSFRHIKVWKI